MDIRQGDIYWAQAEPPDGAGESLPHPQVVVQADALNGSRISSVVVCGLTTNLTRAGWPGNVLLEAGEANLPRQSVVLVSQASVVEKAALGEYIGTLAPERVRQILAGMAFVQSLSQRPDA